MPISFTRLTRDRLQQLSVTLTSLRERVRDAVASEMGKAVGEALRDLVTAILTRKPIRAEPASEFPPAPPSPSPSSRWDDDEEPGWYDDPPGPLPRFDPDRTATVPTVDAIRIGVGLTTWMVHRKVPILAGLGLGLAVGLATLSSHPLVQAGLAVIAAASELVAISEFATQSPSH